MAYAEVKPESAPIIKLMKSGESVTGYYLRQREGKYDSLYDFMGLDGKMFTMAHQSDLSQKMCRIPYKYLCKITLKTVHQTKGGNTFKEFEILADPEKIYDPHRQAGEEG